MVALAVEPFHRRLVPDQGGDDFAVVGRRLLAHDDEIAVEDPGIDHALSADPEDEGRVLADEVPREGKHVLDVFLGEQRVSGGDAAQDGHVDDPLGGLAGPILEDLNGAGLAGIAMDESFLFQGGEMAVHR